MKNEDLCFKIWTMSHNEQGEKVKIELETYAKRFDVILLLEKIGIEINYSTPYAWKKPRAYPIEPQFMEVLEKTKFMRFGEFKYEPHIYIQRA